MVTAAMYTENRSYSEYVLAFRDEMEIEDELIDIMERPDDWLISFAMELSSALRQIDKLKHCGSYEIERERLREAILLEEDRAGRAKLYGQMVSPEAQRFAADVHNFIVGLKSQDPDQRARFERVADKFDIRTKMAHESAEIFALAERVNTGKRGRPKLSPPWRNENHLLETIRNLCLDGVSLSEAARRVADTERRGGADRPNDLMKLYRRKMRLRELNTG